MRVATPTALMLALVSLGCRRSASPRGHSAAPRPSATPSCDHWAECVNAVVATRGGIYVTSAQWNGVPRLLWPPNVPIPAPLLRAGSPPGRRVSARAVRPLVGAALRVDDRDMLLDPPWCRGDDPACMPARDAAWRLTIPETPGLEHSLSLDGTGALHRIERPLRAYNP